MEFYLHKKDFVGVKIFYMEHLLASVILIFDFRSFMLYFVKCVAILYDAFARKCLVGYLMMLNSCFAYYVDTYFEFVLILPMD